jgi:hypothetical protein
MRDYDPTPLQCVLKNLLFLGGGRKFSPWKRAVYALHAIFDGTERLVMLF